MKNINALLPLFVDGQIRKKLSVLAVKAAAPAVAAAAVGDASPGLCNALLFSLRIEPRCSTNQPPDILKRRFAFE